MIQCVHVVFFHNSLMLSCNSVTMATVICVLSFFIRHCLLISDFLNTEKKQPSNQTKIPQPKPTKQLKGEESSEAMQ